MDKDILKLGLVLAIVVTVGLVLTHGVLFQIDTKCSPEEYCYWGWLGVTITLLLTMIITLFGLLALPGARNDQGVFREERIRFAIAVTLLIVYLVLFSNAVLWGEKGFIDQSVMATLTQLMTIVLPFYFGTSGLVEWAKFKERREKDSKDKSGK